MATKDFGDGKIFPQHLRKRREKLCMSRLQAAKQLGCSDTYVANIENGEKVPAYNFLINLAKTYGENPIEYMIWRAQEKQEYDMHRWLKRLESKLKRSFVPYPGDGDLKAAEAKAEYSAQREGERK